VAFGKPKTVFKSAAGQLETDAQPCNQKNHENKDSCPNGSEWCGGPTNEDLPCFACFRDAKTIMEGQ